MKEVIRWVLVGICLGVVAVYVYWFYGISKQVTQNGQAISQIVQFLNNQMQSSQKTTPTK